MQCHDEGVHLFHRNHQRSSKNSPMMEKYSEDVFNIYTQFRDIKVVRIFIYFMMLLQRDSHVLLTNVCFVTNIFSGKKIFVSLLLSIFQKKIVVNQYWPPVVELSCVTYPVLTSTYSDSRQYKKASRLRNIINAIF